MAYSFSIVYDGGEELIVSDGRLVRSELGTLLISFLSMDFSADCWERLLVGDTHPHIAAALSLARSGGAELGGVCQTMERFRRFLVQVTDSVLVNGSGDASCAGGLNELCRTSKTVGSFFRVLSGQIRADIVCVSGGSLYTLGSESTPERCLVSYSAEGLQPLLLLELEMMAAENCTLKRCANCGGYFHPYSGRAIYCDRPVGETGKSCKELAAREKYEQRVASDEALTLIQRRSKTFAMRASRSDDPVVSEQYKAWRAEAENSLKEYRDGALTMDELSQRLELPASPKRPRH